MLTSVNPATGAELGTLQSTNVETMDKIVMQARAAQMLWAELPLKERVAFLQRLHALILASIDALCNLISQEEGKPPFEALSTEILPVAELISYYTKHAPSFLADRSIRLLRMKHRRSYIHYAPLGVIGVIAPWNYPFAIALSETVPALLAGNAVILKPSEITPLVGEQIARLFASAGFPQHVVQVIQGDGKVGEALVRSGLDTIVFTGGTATARRILAATAESLTPVICELGGKDPMIVCADADLERAAHAAVWGAFANAGQMCASVERVYVVATVEQAFLERVLVLTQRLRLNSQGADIGPLINERQLAIVEKQVQDALEQGATILLGGTRSQQHPGFFYPPTILQNVTPDMSIMRDETFGPVMPICAVQDEEEAIRLANASLFGLSASVFSRDKKRAEALARRLAVGTVMINDVISSYGAPETPWGGVKSSGTGRVHGGKQGIQQFCQQRHIMTERISLRRELWWFPYPDWKYTWLKRAIRALYHPT